jgi:hypothetical protein
MYAMVDRTWCLHMAAWSRLMGDRQGARSGRTAIRPCASVKAFRHHPNARISGLRARFLPTTKTRSILAALHPRRCTLTALLLF